jgi:hypothetical protein
MMACDTPAQQHSETSVAAAGLIRPVAGALRQQVYDAVRGAGADGLTDEEGITATGMAANTYRPRRIELLERGLIVDTGNRRATKSGRSAVVWAAASDS